MSIDFTVAAALDLDNDGSFSEDISDRLISAEWESGLNSGFDFVGRDGTARLVVDNEDRRFSPEYTSSPLYPDFTIDLAGRLSTTKDSTTRTMQTAWIKSIKTAPGYGREMTTTILFDSWLGRAANVKPVAIPIQIGKSTSEVLIAIIRAGGLYPPGLPADIWRLGRGRLGETAKLGSVADYFTYETGRATLGIAGDWSADTSLAGAIRNVVGREGGGVFFTDRNGNLVFWDSHHFPLSSTVDATFSGTFQDIEYNYGDQVYNHIVVPVRTKTQSLTPQKLGAFNSTLFIGAGKRASATIQFVDPITGGKLGGRNVIAPVGSVDFVALDGAGVDYTSGITAIITNESTNSCSVQYTNGTPFDLTLQAGFSVRGTKITDYGQSEKTATTGAKVRRQFQWPVALDDPDYAQGLAKYKLRLHADPRGIVDELVLNPGGSDTLLEYALSLTVGSRIRLTERQTALSSKDYFIIGERHSWRAPRHYLVRWKLMPADATRYWVLGDSQYGKLGSTTRPIPI